MFNHAKVIFTIGETKIEVFAKIPNDNNIPKEARDTLIIDNAIKQVKKDIGVNLLHFEGSIYDKVKIFNPNVIFESDAVKRRNSESVKEVYEEYGISEVIDRWVTDYEANKFISEFVFKLISKKESREMSEFVREITKEEYFKLAQNGSRGLFDFYDYRLLDGVKDETESYFLIDFSQQNNIRYYQIDLKTCYDLLTLYHYGDKDYLLAYLSELI